MTCCLLGKSFYLDMLSAATAVTLWVVIGSSVANIHEEDERYLGDSIMIYASFFTVLFKS